MIDYKLVPVEPTTSMVHAAMDAAFIQETDAYDVYDAMLAAAPAVQGEPVAWQVINIKYPKVEPATHNRYPDWAEGDQDLKINPLYAAPQPTAEVLAKGYFHPLPDESDYEFHDAEQFPDGSDCPACVPAVIVRRSAVENQLAPDVKALVEALESAQKEAVRGLKDARTGAQVAAALGRVSAIVGAALATHRKQGGE